MFNESKHYSTLISQNSFNCFEVSPRNAQTIFNEFNISLNIYVKYIVIYLYNRPIFTSCVVSYVEMYFEVSNVITYFFSI